MDGVVMATFTIDPDNNITVLAQVPAGTDRSTTFSTEKELAKLIADWPISRLIDAWNSFAGVAPFDDLKPIKKFTNRKTAVVRIWNAVTRLTPLVAPVTADVASVKRNGKKSPTTSRRAVVARPAAKRAAEPASARSKKTGSKKTDVLALMRRDGGATLAEIIQLTGWQPHTVRGFVSGTLVKKMGLAVDSFRGEGRERTYQIKS
jgi:hypothetical protein